MCECECVEHVCMSGCVYMYVCMVYVCVSALCAYICAYGICVYEWMCVYMYVCVSECVCICIVLERLEADVQSLQLLSPPFSGAGLSVEPRAC